MKYRLNDKGFSHLLGVLLLLVVLGGIGFIGWKVAQRDHATNTGDGTKQSTSTSAADTIAQLQTNLSAKFTLVKKSGAPKTAGTLYYQSSSLSPDWKPAGYNFYVGVQNGQGLELTYAGEVNTTTNTDASSAAKIVGQTLSDQGFSKVTTDPYINAVGGYYKNDQAVCTTYLSDTNPLMVYCAQLTDYGPAAVAIKPLADAYLAGSTSSENHTIVFQTPTIKDSQTAGYKTAEVGMGDVQGMGGFEGLFYQKDGVWHYFTGAQQELSCSKYNTVDLRSAFAGTSCYANDNGDESTVQ